VYKGFEAFASYKRGFGVITLITEVIEKQESLEGE
jgi:hypothetical protein